MKISAVISDILILAGFAFLVYGIGLLSIPAAWIAAGIMLILTGASAGLGRRLNNDHS